MHSSPFSLFLLMCVSSVSLFCFFSPAITHGDHPRRSPTPLPLSPQPSCPCLEPPNQFSVKHLIHLSLSNFQIFSILSLLHFGLWVLFFRCRFVAFVDFFFQCGVFFFFLDKFFNVGLLRLRVFFFQCGFVAFVGIFFPVWVCLVGWSVWVYLIGVGQHSS